MAPSTNIHSVATALRIIEFMARSSGSTGVTEIAREMNLQKARVYRHLRTLVEMGYVTQDAETEKYRLTLRLFHIGQAIADQTEFTAEARRVMPELRQAVNHTVTVSQIEERGCRVLEILRHRSDLEISTRPGALFDFHSSAQGRVALAFGPPRLWEHVRKGSLRDWTGKTDTDLKRIEAEVEQVRRQGWAVAPEQTLVGINALSAPIFDATHALVGTITIVGSLQFLKPVPTREQIDAVTKAARRISHRLGYREASSQ